MIEIEGRSKIKAKIYGKELNLTKPTVGQVEELQTLIEKTEQKAQVGVMRKWAGQLGLPEDFAKEMEVEHFIEVIENLTGVKKK